jgi:hypothetical protein
LTPALSALPLTSDRMSATTLLESGTPASGPRLRRALSLWDLMVYGVIVISPMAPMTFFGILSQRGHGHAATAILLAMLAMLLTAISYGRMARAHPIAGSAFTYVGREISPAAGYVTGWSMVLDYLVNPMINVIFCSQQAWCFGGISARNRESSEPCGWRSASHLARGRRADSGPSSMCSRFRRKCRRRRFKSSVVVPDRAMRSQKGGPYSILRPSRCSQRPRHDPHRKRR